MTTVWTSLIAICGTLAGALTSGWMQARVGRAQRREAVAEARRDALLVAVGELVSALADHRLAMWRREDRRLAGAAAEVVDAARAASHETRAAVTAPLVRVSVLAPSLRAVVQEAEQATYALRGAADQETLGALREQALQASDRLVAEAGQAFAQQ
jgi:hypothetical protein